MGALPIGEGGTPLREGSVKGLVARELYAIGLIGPGPSKIGARGLLGDFRRSSSSVNISKSLLVFSSKVVSILAVLMRPLDVDGRSSGSNMFACAGRTP